MKQVSNYKTMWVTHRQHKDAYGHNTKAIRQAGKKQKLLTVLLALGLTSTMAVASGTPAQGSEETGKTIYVSCEKPAGGEPEKTDDTGDGSLSNPFGTLGSNAQTTYVATGGGVNGALINNPDAPRVSEVLFATGGTCEGTLRPQISGVDKDHPLVIGAYDPTAEGDAKGLRLSGQVSEADHPVLQLSSYAYDTKELVSVVHIENQQHITVENLTITAPLTLIEKAKATEEDTEQDAEQSGDTSTAVMQQVAYNPTPQGWKKNFVLSPVAKDNKLIFEGVATTDEYKYGQSQWTVPVADQAHVAIKITNTDTAKEDADIGKDSVISGITVQNTTIKNINCSENGCSGYTKDRNTDRNGKGDYIDLAAVMITDMRPMPTNSNDYEAMGDITIRNNSFKNISTYGVRSWVRANREDLVKAEKTSDEIKRLEKPITNFLVENNTFTDLGKGAIISGNTLNANIINNTVTRHGLNNRYGSAGIWPYFSKNTIIKNNTVTDGQPVNDKCDIWTSYSRSQQQKVIAAKKNKQKPEEGLQEQFIGCNDDGQAFDLDNANINTIFENNTSANNARGFLLICGGADKQVSNEDGTTTNWNNELRNQNAIIRYNTSYNDNTYGIRFNCSGVAKKIFIHNNTTVLNGDTWESSGRKGQQGKLHQAVFTNCTNGNCLFFDNPKDGEKGEPTTENWGNQFHYANNLTVIYGDATATTPIRKNTEKETSGDGNFKAEKNYVFGGEINNPANRDRFMDKIKPNITDKNGTIDETILGWYSNASFPSFYETTSLEKNPLVGNKYTPEHNTKGNDSGNSWLDAGSDAYKLQPEENTDHTTLAGTSVTPDYELSSPNNKVKTSAQTDEENNLHPSQYEIASQNPHDIYDNPVTFMDKEPTNNPNIGAANAVKATLAITSPENKTEVTSNPDITFTGTGNTGDIVEVQGLKGWNTCGIQEKDADGNLLNIEMGKETLPLLKGTTVNHKGLWECQSVLKDNGTYDLYPVIATPGETNTQNQAKPTIIYIKNN